jgi:hypothetical protein
MKKRSLKAALGQSFQQLMSLGDCSSEQGPKLGWRAIVGAGSSVC